MKKIIVAILLLYVLVPVVMAKETYLESQLKDVNNNTYYNSVKKYKRSYDTSNLYAVKKIENLKDPQLIKFTQYTPISDADYDAKLKKDEEIYKKIAPKIKTYNEVNYFNVYKISERLIRANNLDYVNWRVAVRKTATNVNAASMNGNFICINTALYDTLESSEDALAFVLAHEMAHQILGHSQRTAELTQNVTNAKTRVKYATSSSERQALRIAADKVERNAMSQSRMMEYMADSEAFILLTKAGYSPEKAMEALYVIDALPNINSVYNSHPVTQNRINSAIENIAVLDPNWVYAGRENIYNSEVLPGKKSSDRVSFVINKSKKEKAFYQPETQEQRVRRVAYRSYLNGNMENSAKYFEMLTKIKSDYISYLYLSYSNQYLYNQTNRRKFKRRAAKAAKRAYELNSQDKNVKMQIDELQVKL